MLNLFRRPLILAIALLAAAAAALPAAPPASAQSRDADFSEFYQALEPFGRWLEHPRWGVVWSPDAQEEEDWRPYSRGQWVFTEEHGWYWESDEEWGWATYHYGRWMLDDRYGWIWVPGNEWAPAWVAWRESDEYIGWAPLPPDAVWEPEYGVRFAYEEYETPRMSPIWCFVEPSHLLTPRVWRHFADRSRNVFILGRTRHATRYSVVDRRIFNRGIDVRRLAHITRQPVPTVRVRAINAPRDNAWRRGERSYVGIYRPRLAPHPQRARFSPRLTPPDAVEGARRARATPRDFDPRNHADRDGNRRPGPSFRGGDPFARNTPPSANQPRGLKSPDEGQRWRDRSGPPAAAVIPSPQQPRSDDGRRSFRGRFGDAPPAVNLPPRREPPSDEASRRRGRSSDPPASGNIAPRFQQPRPQPQVQAAPPRVAPAPPQQPRPQLQVQAAPQREPPAQNNQQRGQRRDNNDRDAQKDGRPPR